jgi:hypothetical protein
LTVTVPTYLPAGLLIGAIAWCTATRGAVDPPEMVVAATLVFAAWLTSVRRNKIRRSRSAYIVRALVLTLFVWLIVDGPMRVGLTIEAVRVPFLVFLVVLAASTVSRLDDRQIEAALLGVVALGLVHAGLAVAGSVAQLPSVVQGGDFYRATSLVGNPNALGVILVATGCLTIREVLRRPSMVLAGGLALQAVALLLTASRLALAIALCVVAVCGLRSGSLRVKKLLLPWGVLALAVFAFRTASSPPNPRPALWVAAVSRISEHPLIGSGPVLQVYFAHPSRQATTHAHNELLQFAVDRPRRAGTRPCSSGCDGPRLGRGPTRRLLACGGGCNPVRGWICRFRLADHRHRPPRRRVTRRCVSCWDQRGQWHAQATDVAIRKRFARSSFDALVRQLPQLVVLQKA